MAMQPDNIENAVTVIIGQRVHHGVEKQFMAWQHELNDFASRYSGFIGAEVTAPTEVQPDWTVIYRFDSMPNLRAWLDSSTRQRFLATGRKYLDGPATQQIVGGASKPTDQLVTVVVTHRVSAEDTDEFLEWQERLRLAESKFDGYRGTEIFRPVEGEQDEWTAMYRYDSAAQLEAWLTSDERQRLLDEGEKFRDFELRKVDNSFGNWFAFDEKGHAAAPPSDFKTSVAVWVGLYPTVVMLSLALLPLKMPLWLGMLVGNLLSSFTMTFVTMPFYVNRVLRRWLWPLPNVPQGQTNWRGFGIVVVLMAFWTVTFYLITKVFFHLP